MSHNSQAFHARLSIAPKKFCKNWSAKGDAKARRKAMRDITMPVAWQMTLFQPESHPLVEEIKNLAIDELTPIEAISKLYELQQKAKRDS